jgi:hypothetical protein
MLPGEATDSFCLDTLTEVGPLGFILFFVYGECGADRALRNERRRGRPQTAAGRGGSPVSRAYRFRVLPMTPWRTTLSA